MSQEVKTLIIQEKRFSFILMSLYVMLAVFFVSASVGLFLIPSAFQTMFLSVSLGTLLLFVVALYMTIVNLLKTHRKIAKNYQQIFELENIPSFELCRQYFKDAGFLVYEDDNLIIANKLLVQENKGRIKRDYLVQVVATLNELSLENYMETHQETMSKYFAEFQKMVAVTQNKVITVGAFIHYVREIPEELALEFKIQAQQRYLLRLDIIIDEESKKLYYPSHIESYKNRRWCGQLLPAPYNEIEKFVRKVYL